MSTAVDDEQRLKQSVTTSKSGSVTDTHAGDAATARTLLNIIAAVALSVVTLAFLHYFNHSPVFVLVACCTYIVLYGAFITFVINRVESCFQDSTLALAARWSTTLALVVSVMLAIGTIKTSLYDRPAGKSIKLGDGPGNQPGFQQGAQQQFQAYQPGSMNPKKMKWMKQQGFQTPQQQNFQQFQRPSQQPQFQQPKQPQFVYAVQGN